MSGGLASLHTVATLPTAQRQGIGTAVSAAPLRAARVPGYRVAILQPTAMGDTVYRRLGCSDCLALPRYAWQSRPATQ